MRFIQRKVVFEIQIKRPDYNAPMYSIKPPIIRFTSDFTEDAGIDEIVSNDLISYNFSESLGSVASPFTLNLLPTVDAKGRSWLERITLRDLVFIYEFGELRYVGYVESMRYSSEMDNDGKPNRNIIVSGGSLGKLLSTLTLVLNQAYFNTGDTAESAYKKLITKLSTLLEPGGRIAPVFKIIYDDFMDLIKEVGQLGYVQGVKGILDYFISFTNGISNDLKAQYPVSLSLYNVGSNNIWQIWSNLLFPPVNELFARWNTDHKQLDIIFRKTPFDASDWKDLPVYDIPSLIVTDFDINRSDNEVFTFYLGTLPGAGIGENLAILMANSASKNYAIDKDLWSIFGFKPLIVEFKYFDTSKVEEFNSASALIKDISNMLKTWYEHNDTFYSGKLTIMTPDTNKTLGKNPRIGERINFLDGTFYIEESTHSWSYGNSMETVLSLSRGAQYNQDGSWKSPISKIGRSIQAISLTGD